jgi:sarcosine oxidase
MHDVAVIGLGVMGAAAAREIAGRRARVVAFDGFAPPHTLGSSHGRTRIIREAYFEHPLYVPLVRRAYALWSALERSARTRLLVPTGGLMIGRPEGALVAGALASARAHDVEHQLLEGDEVRRRFAGLEPPSDEAALFEVRAGLLLPERCHAALLEHARAAGADLRFDTRVTGWRAAGEGFVVDTARGSFHASRLVLAAGAWLPALVPELELPLSVTRQLLHWYDAGHEPERYRAERLPIAVWEHEPGRIVAFYSDTGDGLKAGIHHEGEVTDPDAVRRAVIDAEERTTRALLERLMPHGRWRRRDDAVCLYTTTPDHHFVIDQHPAHARVAVASACSGHGFKFAPALAEILADLALDGGTDGDIAAFRVARFGR